MFIRLRRRISSGSSLGQMWKWELGLKWFVKSDNMLLVLAGSTAEVQTRLHQSFPVPSAGAGAKEAGEEGAGRLGKPQIRRCSQAEDGPQRPVDPSRRYRASSHPHLSHQLHCQLSHCSCRGSLPHTEKEERDFLTTVCNF